MLVDEETGSTYTGNLLNGKKHGKGKEFMNDGSSYVGEFYNGKRQGKGYIVNSNLDILYCEYIDGELVGI